MGRCVETASQPSSVTPKAGVRFSPDSEDKDGAQHTLRVVRVRALNFTESRGAKPCGHGAVEAAISSPGSKGLQ